MPGNQYGFDFLRTDHRLDDEGKPIQESVEVDAPAAQVGILSAADFAAVQNKPDLEKQFDILAFLQAHRGSGCLAPDVIYKATGIDLDVEIKVAEMLQKNPKIRLEMVPDPENPALTVATYAYQAKYSTVRDRTSLLAQINRMTAGVPMRDLLDSYTTVEEDLKALITAGDVLAVANTEDKDKILFPRGDVFLVELDGHITLPPSSTEGGGGSETPNGNHADLAPHSHGTGSEPPAPAPPPPCFVMNTDTDPQRQIRRGEAVQVGGQWFRVSSAVRDGVPLEDQPSRAQAPLSVVSLIDLSKRNEVDGYTRPFTSKLLPLDAALNETAVRNVTAAKTARERLLKLAHGRSGGVAGQLLGSHAHASNPNTLAASFASAGNNSSHMSAARKRPATAAAKNVPHIVGSSSLRASSAAIDKNALQKAASNPALSLYSHARRHGCTKDVRAMYLETRTLVPESDFSLQQLLLEHKLLNPGEQMRRKRLATKTNVDNDGKPKKRRYYERKNQRMTNTHLEGTEIGAVLARAAEKQRQGGTVGDGGM